MKIYDYTSALYYTLCMHIKSKYILDILFNVKYNVI